MRNTICKSLFVLCLLAFAQTALAEWQWAGDVNKDGELNIADVIVLTQAVNGKAPTPELFPLYDVNQDKTIDNEDIRLLIEMILENKPKEKVWIINSIPVNPGQGSEFD